MDITTYIGSVYPWHCDHMGHMNIMWYVGKFDEANWNLFAAIGLTPSYMRSESMGMAAVQQNITYEKEALPGDVIEVRSRILEMGDKSIRFVHEMRDRETSAVLAECELTGVHLDRMQRKAARFPDDIRANVEKLFAATR
jgi:acyl-CoA thioester hydrolase